MCYIGLLIVCGCQAPAAAADDDDDDGPELPLIAEEKPKKGARARSHTWFMLRAGPVRSALILDIVGDSPETGLLCCLLSLNVVCRHEGDGEQSA